jgi:hypothetical protein
MRYDCICLCETWLTSSNFNDFLLPEYNCVNKPRIYRSKRAKRGLGGVIFYFHISLSKHVEVQESAHTEDRIWIKIKDDNSNDNRDVFCCFCYVPPVNSIVMCNEASQWSTMEAEVIHFLSKGKVMTCGDLNAKTGNMYDFIPEDSDIPINLPCGYTPDSNMGPLTSQDTKVNTQGKHLLDMCLLDMCVSFGMRIMNGRHSGDPNGSFTCYTPRGM